MPDIKLAHEFEMTEPSPLWRVGKCSCGWFLSGQCDTPEMEAAWEHHVSVVASQVIASLPSILSQIAYLHLTHNLPVA